MRTTKPEKESRNQQAKIRILHVIDHLGLGGGQISLKSIVENQTGNIEAMVCALRKKSQEIEFDFPVIYLRCSKYSPMTIFKISKLCRKYDIDILHTHLSKSIITCLLASYFCKAKVIVHERGAVSRKGFGLYRILLKYLHHRACAIIANSQSIAKILSQRSGIKPNLIEVLYNPVDFKNFNIDANPKSTACEPAKSAKSITIGYVGRLHPVKGVDILINAFKIILAKNPNCQLVLAGDGPQRKLLEKLCIRLNISNRVKFLGMCSNIAEIMSTFDIAVIPSRQEPFGRVAIEFMRMKVPLICSGVDGLGEIVNNNSTGIITEDNTPVSIAQSVENLLKNKQSAQQLVNAAFEYSKQFDAVEHVRKLNIIYSKISENYAKQ